MYEQTIQLFIPSQNIEEKVKGHFLGLKEEKMASIRKEK